MSGSTAQCSPVWDILNPWVMFRFVVYGYTLSRYKRFKYAGQKLVGQLDPREAEARTKQLKCAIMDTSCGRYKRPGMNRLEKEFRDIKSWLSKLSNDWLLHTIARLPRLHKMSS